MMKLVSLHHGRSIWMSAGRNVTRYVHTQRLDSGERKRFSDKVLRFVLLSGLGLSFPIYLYLTGSGIGNHGRSSFQKYTLEGRERYSSTSSIFELKAKSDTNWTQLWGEGLWSIEIKQPQLQIAREYTPLPAECSLSQHYGDASLTEGDSHECLQLWIRRETSGEVSNYLHKLDVGSVVELRGPKSRTDVPEASDIIFLAGGTGITPAFQLAHLLLKRCRNPTELPNMHILWANRRREDCAGGVSDHSDPYPSNRLLELFGLRSTTSADDRKSILVRRLERLKDAFQGKLKVDYYVDEENTRISKKIILGLLNPVTGQENPASRQIVMVCGPDGFVNHFAGPKQWQNGKQVQGQLSGILQGVDRLGWEVIKL